MARVWDGVNNISHVLFLPITTHVQYTQNESIRLR